MAFALAIVSMRAILQQKHSLRSKSTTTTTTTTATTTTNHWFVSKIKKKKKGLQFHDKKDAHRFRFACAYVFKYRGRCVKQSGVEYENMQNKAHIQKGAILLHIYYKY